MQPIKKPKIVYLKGKEAVEALSTFIDELEKQRGEELTNKQTDALIRIANELITSIEAQIKTNATPQREYLPLTAHIKRMINPLTKPIC